MVSLWQHMLLRNYWHVAYKVGVSAAYIIAKLLVYSIQESICKIPINCGKFHATSDFFCLQTEVNASNIATD